MFEYEENKENSGSEANSDNQEKYETFGYEDEEDLKISQSYAQRMIQKKQLERKKRKGNIWVSRLHVVLRLVILAGLIFFMYKLVNTRYWYVDKNIFTTTNPNLEIINNNIVPTYKILNELRKIPVTTEPIYKFETDKIRLNLNELEPIEDIYIRRYWFPARLQIIVKERTPVISIYTGESETPIAFYTDDGVLIGGDYLPLPESIKTLKVIANGSFREWDKEKIDAITNLARYLEQLTNEKVETINISSENDVYIKITSYLLRVGEFDSSVYERISRLASILPNIKLVTKPIKYIDLRWKGAAYIKTE
ncbi:cell division protein FtsQ/DivIB [bacterium]|nr:cell division protein FtsQ/DivIB [bacterium]